MQSLTLLCLLKLKTENQMINIYNYLIKKHTKDHHLNIKYYSGKLYVSIKENKVNKETNSSNIKISDMIKIDVIDEEEINNIDFLTFENEIEIIDKYFPLYSQHKIVKYNHHQENIYWLVDLTKY